MNSSPQRDSKAHNFREFARRSSRRRMPSSSGYMAAAAAAAAALFFVLWWMLQEDEAPWVPAGLAASVVVLVAAFAREVVMRRAWSRYLLEETPGERFESTATSRRAAGRTSFSQTEALRTIEKQAAESDAPEALPDAHLKVFKLCSEFLDSAEKSLSALGVTPERRLTVRTRQERVRVLQKHHLLAWARDSARSLTHEAQQRARLHEKVETANRALDCIDAALQKYPDEDELKRSATAVRDFINSSRVAHWVELAQRASFKGRYRRAIDCYRDALFYLTRADATPEHQAAAEQITREIEILRARMTTHKAVDSEAASPRQKRKK
jgi:tetratricopeptide (TPR) repeat protein